MLIQNRKLLLVILLGICSSLAIYVFLIAPRTESSSSKQALSSKPALSYKPRQPFDTGGFAIASSGLRPWQDPTSLEQIRDSFDKLGYRGVRDIDRDIGLGASIERQIKGNFLKAQMFLYEGDAKGAYQVLERSREWAISSD